MGVATSVRRSDLASAIEALGLSARPVCVHSSLASFGHVTGGADAVVDSLLGAGCTVMVPAHTWAAYSVRPRLDQWWERNAAHPAFLPTPDHNRLACYTPDSDAVDRNMGAIPAAVVARPDRVRGDHALMSFAAVGPDAHDLISAQAPDRVFGPIEALIERAGVWVLMGVGLERLTLLHHAEVLAGRRPFVRWANGTDGEPAEFDAGGCSAGFGQLEPVLARLLRRRVVGRSAWIAGEAAAVVSVAADAMRRDPSITHCRGACSRCEDAIAGGPARRAPLPR